MNIRVLQTGRFSCAVDRLLASQVGNCFIDVFLEVKCGLGGNDSESGFMIRRLLTLTLLTWTIWRAPTNASKWRMGFNSVFKGLIKITERPHSLASPSLLEIFADLISLTVGMAGNKLRFLPDTRRIYF